MCLLVLTFFFVSVKGAKGATGPIGYLGTKGVGVISPCYSLKMCIKFLPVEGQIYDRKVCSLCVSHYLFNRDIPEEKVHPETWELEARW